MKSLSICIVFTFFSMTVSLGYQFDETMQFVDDCKLMSSEKFSSMEDTCSVAQAYGYIMGVVASKGYSVRRLANESAKKFSIQSNTFEALEKRATELQTYGYIMPDNVSARLLAKVIVKYADDNPEKLTMGVVNFMEDAFKDAWGEKE